MQDYEKDGLKIIAKTILFKYIENFNTQKWKLSDEKVW